MRLISLPLLVQLVPALAFVGSGATVPTKPTFLRLWVEPHRSCWTAFRERSFSSKNEKVCTVRVRLRVLFCVVLCVCVFCRRRSPRGPRR
jgi:hypothetical protein